MLSALKQQMQQTIQDFKRNPLYEKNKNDVEQILTAMSNSSSEIDKFIKNPSKINALFLAVKFFSKFTFEKNRPANWTSSWDRSLYDDSISKLLFDTFQKPSIAKHIKTWTSKQGDNSVVKYAQFKNVVFAAQFTTDDVPASYVYVKADGKIDVAAVIHELFWTAHEHKQIKLFSHKVSNSYDNNHHFKITKLQDTVPLISKIALLETEKLQKALDLNISRSILYYGNPGTGKSTICSYIAYKLNLKTIKIKFSDLSKSDYIISLIECLKPEAIIIDDIDRSNDKVLIEFLEHITKHTKLVLATANNIFNIDSACLRPGRFDDIVEVSNLDEAVVRNLLGENNQQWFETVKDWPIAYIQELITRTKLMMSADEIKESFKTLYERIKAVEDQVVKGSLQDQTLGKFADQNKDI